MAHSDEAGDTRKVVFSVLSFLDEEYNKATTTPDSKESLEVAMQCLETAFGVSLRDSTYKTSVSLRNLVLNSPSSAAPPAAASNRATSTTFGLDSLLGAAAAVNEVDLGQTYVSPPETTDAEKKIAEENKNKGNEEMKNGKYHEALSLYNRAIELDGSKAVYFCNRAAAFTKLEKYVEALRDCQIACQLQPTYARAFGRMGVIYSQMGSHREAIQCYRKAVLLEPNNESYTNNLKLALEMVGGGDTANAVPSEGAAGAGGPNLNNVFNNPLLINMASQMLQDPGMQQMVRSFMTGIHNGPEGTQSLENILQMGQAVAQQIQAANPNLAEQLGSTLNNQEPRSSQEQNDSYDL